MLTPSLAVVLNASLTMVRYHWRYNLDDSLSLGLGVLAAYSE